MADSSRRMLLFGGGAALALGAIVLLLDLMQDDFLLGKGLVAAGFVTALGAYLVIGAAPWTSADPAWARWMRRLWEIPFLALLGGFMLWVRLLPYPALVGQGRAYYIGTDPFYHYREVLGIVRSFPAVPRWDPWTFYPNGTGTGQFGSLFDWGAAAYVVATAGRNASEAYIQTVLGAYPAVLGAILVVPFYFVAKKLLGTPGAVVATITIALLPGEFLIRSVAGYSDHHVAEALTALVGILGVYVAATKSQALKERIVSAKATLAWRGGPLPWAILGGLALALNFYVWQPAILFLAILTLWLTIVILLEDGKGGDARGYVFGGAVSFAVTGVLMIPVVETFNIGEFNTYGILHPIASFLAALWLVGVHFAARWTKARGHSPWVVPGVVAAGAILGYLVVSLFLADLYSSVLWGLSWVTGFGVQRTMLTIAEARQAQFFCQNDTNEFSCLATDFGAAAPLAVLLLIALFVWTLWKRRSSDILLLIWSFVVFRATTTQIRFSYYLALNIALLIGWLAARIAEGSGLERALAGHATTESAAPARGTKGRKTKRAQATAAEARWWQFAVVAAALLLVMPGNVFATQSARPAWTSANIRGADGDLVMWMEGLDWMREHTPDAGVDLGLIVDKPPEGELFDYPPQTYGVLTWWDYGHWIQTIAQRPPVANPFQQAAPFAATWFTERDPDVAEKLLDDWVQGKGPVRYIFIDAAIGKAFSKFGAITVWANSVNASRPPLVDPSTRQIHTAWVNEQRYDGADGPKQLRGISPLYTDSMMGRLFGEDGNGLSHYRLVWENPSYGFLLDGSTTSGELRCVQEYAGTEGCPPLDGTELAGYGRGRYAKVGDMYAYNIMLASQLKLFERVQGARLVGTTTPGATVSASVGLEVHNGVNRGYGSGQAGLVHTVEAVAGPDGRFEIVFPYPTSEPLSAVNGGTEAIVTALGPVSVDLGVTRASVEIPERAVIDGLTIEVAAP